MMKPYEAAAQKGREGGKREGKEDEGEGTGGIILMISTAKV